MRTRTLLPTLGAAVAAVLLPDAARSQASKPKPPSAAEVYITVNGTVITKQAYLRALERAPVVVPGTQQPVPAMRYVLDQLVGRTVVLAEAAKQGVLPTEAAVQKRLALQQRMVEQQSGGKTFARMMAEQGTTPADMSEEIRYQLAESNLVARRLGLTEADYRKTYEEKKAQWVVADRAQLRVIAVPAASPAFVRATDLLAAKTDFAAVARQVNEGALKTSAGLLPQVAPVSQLPAAWQTEVRKTPVGGVFGPVEAPTSATNPVEVKAWVKVEAKTPGFALSFDDAKVLVQQSLVQEKIKDPAYTGVRAGILRLKSGAAVKAADPRHDALWKTLVEQARAAGVP